MSDEPGRPEKTQWAPTSTKEGAIDVIGALFSYGIAIVCVIYSFVALASFLESSEPRRWGELAYVGVYWGCAVGFVGTLGIPPGAMRGRRRVVYRMLLLLALTVLAIGWSMETLVGGQ